MATPSTTPPHSRGPATAAALGAILLWCFYGVLNAAGTRAIGVMPYLTLSAAVGVATIAMVYLLRGRSLLDLLRIPPRVMLAGFFGVVLYTLMLTLAVGIAPERDLGHVMLLNYLWPIWMILLSLGLLEERPRVVPGLAGALLGFAGVVVARGQDALTHLPSHPLPQLLALLAGFLWALYSILLRRWKVPAEQGGSSFHFLLCALLAGLIAAGTGEWRKLAAFDTYALILVLLGGAGPIGLAYYWWEIGIKRGTVHLIALLAYFIPLGSVLLMGLFYQQAMSPWLLLGAVLIALGAWVGRGAD